MWYCQQAIWLGLRVEPDFSEEEMAEPNLKGRPWLLRTAVVSKKDWAVGRSISAPKCPQVSWMLEGTHGAWDPRARVRWVGEHHWANRGSHITGWLPYSHRLSPSPEKAKEKWQGFREWHLRKFMLQRATLESKVLIGHPGFTVDHWELETNMSGFVPTPGILWID